MKDVIAGKRYAKAICESFSAPTQLERLGVELADFSTLFHKNKDLKSFLLNPAFLVDLKKSVVQDVAQKSGYSDETEKTLLLLVENGRVGIIREVAEEFELLSFEILGKIRAHIKSARKMSDEDVKRLEEKLGAITGKKVVVDVDVDKSLLGGIVASVGSRVYDGSVKNQLRALRVGL